MWMDHREGEGVRTVCNKIMSKNGLVGAQGTPAGDCPVLVPRVRLKIPRVERIWVKHKNGETIIH